MDEVDLVTPEEEAHLRSGSVTLTVLERRLLKTMSVQQAINRRWIESLEEAEDLPAIQGCVARILGLGEEQAKLVRTALLKPNAALLFWKRTAVTSMVMLSNAAVVVESAQALVSSRVSGRVNSEALEDLADSVEAFEGHAGTPTAGPT
jgi:hypothetical protein